MGTAAPSGRDFARLNHGLAAAIREIRRRAPNANDRRCALAQRPHVAWILRTASPKRCGGRSDASGGEQARRSHARRDHARRGPPCRHARARCSPRRLICRALGLGLGPRHPLAFTKLLGAQATADAIARALQRRRSDVRSVMFKL